MGLCDIWQLKCYHLINVGLVRHICNFVNEPPLIQVMTCHLSDVDTGNNGNDTYSYRLPYNKGPLMRKIFPHHAVLMNMPLAPKSSIAVYVNWSLCLNSRPVAVWEWQADCLWWVPDRPGSVIGRLHAGLIPFSVRWTGSSGSLFINHIIPRPLCIYINTLLFISPVCRYNRIIA